MRSRDSGLGLIEVLVAMTILSIALAIFGMAFAAMLRTSSASGDMGDATEQVRLALAQLDRQVRSGYWVKTKDIPGSAEVGLQLLTVDASGQQQCWVWAIDAAAGRLLSLHYSPDDLIAIPSMNTFGNPSSPWRAVAGQDAADVDPLGTRVSGTFSVGGEVEALDAATLTRQTYSRTAFVTLAVTKPGLDGGLSQSLDLSLAASVRNQWAGAIFAGRC